MRAPIALVVAATALSGPVASAQSRSLLVLPVAIGDADPAAEAARAERIVASIPSGELSPLPLASARARFEESASAEPPSVSESDIERWLTLSRQVVRHLAHADYAAAREMLLEAQLLFDRAAEELNREPARARQVLDTCLYEVRALVEARDPRAQPRALECRRLVPRVEPSRLLHPPEVIELLAQIDRRLAQAPPGRLQIESEPSGCAVRLNGIELGRTPFVAGDLVPGDYRAQVECDSGRRARVHRVRVGEGTTLVRVDARFDAAVRTDTVLRLAYPAPAAASHRRGDAQRIAGVLGAEEVWLVLDAGRGVMRIERLDAREGRVRAVVRAHETALGNAIGALTAGRSGDWTSGTAVALSGEPREVDGGPRGEGSADRTGEIVLGSLMGAAAIGGWISAFGFYEWRLAAGRRLAVAEPTDPDYLTRQQVWLDRRYPIWITSWASAIVGTAALPFLLPSEQDVPWWSWMIAGAGAVVAAIGIAEIVLASPCASTERQTQQCVDRAAPIDRGIIVSSMALPLVSVPVVYAIRALTGSPPANAGIEVGPQGARIQVGGEF